MKVIEIQRVSPNSIQWTSSTRSQLMVAVPGVGLAHPYWCR